jgi:hypothetical protein
MDALIQRAETGTLRRMHARPATWIRPRAVPRGGLLERSRLGPWLLGCAGLLPISCGRETPVAADVPLARDAQTGALKLTLRTPQGEAWSGACAVFAAPSAGSGTGAEVEVSRPLQRGPHVDAALAPGRWRLRVDPEEPLVACSAGSAPPFSVYGAARADCEIRAGETTALEIRLVAGGHLSLTLVPPASFQDARIEMLKVSPPDELCQHALELCLAKTENPCAVVSVLSGTTPRLGRVSFLAPGCTRLAADRAIPGFACTSESFFEAGPLTLGIETPGFEPLTATITIESGHATDLRLALKPLTAAK